MSSPDQNNILLYSTSAAAQVWAALLVFQVLLVRDQKSAISKEVDELWKQARYWWKGLIQALRDDNLPNLGHLLGKFGLDKATVDRAETDRTSFKKLMKEVHKHQIILKHDLSTVTLNRVLSPDVFQGTMDPIAERLAEIDEINLSPKLGFVTGMLAIIINMGALLTLESLLSRNSAEEIILLIGTLNGILALFFGIQILNSLDKG